MPAPPNPQNPAPSPPTPRPAATVMLLRETDAVEVLVIRRHEQLAFMGGMWVFPGGAASPDDTSAAALSCVPERLKADFAAMTDLHGLALDQAQRLGLALTACRETFEETGMLLATHRDGEPCHASVLLRAQAQRTTQLATPAGFATFLEDARLVVSIDQLLYWAHWITPSQASRRFDTRFFAALAPPSQRVALDATEAVDHAWMTPAALIAAAARHDMPVSPPTLYSLMELDERLRAHGCLSALFIAETGRRIIPILPKLVRDAPAVIVMPWDPRYQELPGEGVCSASDYPEALRNLPSRTAFNR